MAVQGGLLASVVASRKERSKLGAFWATLSFLLAKLFVYTSFGFLLGSVGSALQLPIFVVVTIQLLAGLYMIGIALNLLNVHPIFRRLLIQPPAFLRKAVRDQSKSHKIFAPAFLGLMTVFVPCGTTLSMEALAVSTTNGFSGAATMALFTLGTFPLFLVLGVAVGGARNLSRKWAFVPAAILVYLGLSSVNGSLVLLGSPVTFEKIGGGVKTLAQVAINPAGDLGRVRGAGVGEAQIVDGIQIAKIDVYPNRYSPKVVEVRVGVPVRLSLSGKGNLGCTSTFVIPKLKEVRNLATNPEATIEFTPNAVGEIPFTCGMGMYTGTIRVL